MTPGGANDNDDDLVPMAEINVTPFIDVMLVLLVIFMITAPLLAAGVKVDLPQARSPQLAEDRKPVVLTITADGRIHLGDSEIAKGELVVALRAAIVVPDRHIHVRGDARAGYGDIVEVLDLLAVNGFTKVALMTRKPSDSQSMPR